MSLIMRGIVNTLQSGATTGNGTVVTLPARSVNLHITITGSGTITGGTIAVQEANSESYAGTWSTLDSFPASDLTGGAQKVYHFSGIYRALRIAPTVNLTGGGTFSAEVVMD